MEMAKAGSKSKGGKVKAPGQKMNKFVWGQKGGHKEWTIVADDWDDAFASLLKIKKGEWVVDRSAPGNSSNRRFIVHPRNPGEKAVYARMLKTEDGTITIQKGAAKLPPGEVGEGTEALFDQKWSPRSWW